MVGWRRLPALSPAPLTACGQRLRVFLAGFEVEPELPAGIGGVPVEVVHRAPTASEAAVSAGRIGVDVVLGDASLANIADRLQESGAVALLRTNSAADVAANGGGAVPGPAYDVVEPVLAIASIRAFCPAES